MRIKPTLQKMFKCKGEPHPYPQEPPEITRMHAMESFYMSLSTYPTNAFFLLFSVLLSVRLLSKLELKGASGLLVAPSYRFSEPRAQATSSSGPTQSTSERAQLDALLKAFQNESGGYGADPSAASASYHGSVPYTLPDVATPSSLAPLLSDKDVQERLSQHLPSGLSASESTLRSVVHSPEIRRSLASLDQALRTGALGPLVQSLGLKPDAALSVDNFLQGMKFSFSVSPGKEV